VKFCWRKNLMKICDKTFGEKKSVVYRQDVEFYDPALGGVLEQRDPSVCPMAQLPRL